MSYIMFKETNQIMLEYDQDIDLLIHNILSIIWGSLIIYNI